MNKTIPFISFLMLCCISPSLLSQELVDIAIGKGGFLDIKFQKVDSFYYQIGTFDDSYTVGFNAEQQTITETGSFKEDQVYVVKYDLDFNIIWTKVIQYSNKASKLQMKYEKDYLYIMWAEKGSDKVKHFCFRINIDDPEELDYVLDFETGLANANYIFDLSENGAIAVAGVYSDRIKFDFPGQINDEYFCNSSQDVFLLRYAFQSVGTFSHIVQREWGNPGVNKREFHGLQFDANENIHLFGYGQGSAQLDGNLGDAIGNYWSFR